MVVSPLVSVVMCTYYGERYLDQQISSVLEQEYPNIEFIIVDDCSTDDTWNMLQKWQQKIPTLKIFKNEVNLGYNKNFEKAIQLASGQFISICDQDDIWLPQKISKTIEAFTDENIVLAHCRSVRFENGNLNYKKAKLHYHFSGNDTRKLFFFNQIMGHDMVFRKELVSKIIPIPPLMSYDWWIAVVASSLGAIAAVNDFLVHHRIHTSNNFFNKNAAAKKKELDMYETLELFTHIETLTSSERQFLNQLLQLLVAHNKRNNKSIDYPLFKFFYQNRKIVFGHKKRLLRELSYLKNAIKYAKLDYKGKGMTI